MYDNSGLWPESHLKAFDRVTQRSKQDLQAELTKWESYRERTQATGLSSPQAFAIAMQTTERRIAAVKQKLKHLYGI